MHKNVQPPEQNGPLTKNNPAKQTIPPPVKQLAEKPEEYKPPLASAPVPGDMGRTEGEWDDMPPPPDNFPDAWETQWQPSFEAAAIASKPEPKFKKNEELTPPR
ncbi:MAG: hypothetical protein FIB03_21910, partial [Anaerolineae bacterium]|nr:hypothetical protein [Anaerolineae bacterium]